MGKNLYNGQKIKLKVVSERKQSKMATCMIPTVITVTSVAVRGGRPKGRAQRMCRTQQVYSIILAVDTYPIYPNPQKA